MSTVKTIFKIIVFYITAFVYTGCASSRVIDPSKLKLMPDFCVTSLKPARNEVPVIYYNSDSLLKKELLLNEYMTKRDILMANASGSLDVLHQMEGLLADSVKQKKAYLLYSTELEKN
ncbi:MAG TPA: hypothetical protein VGH64_01790, partial [Puia sp.]